MDTGVLIGSVFTVTLIQTQKLIDMSVSNAGEHPVRMDSDTISYKRRTYSVARTLWRFAF